MKFNQKQLEKFELEVIEKGYKNIKDITRKKIMLIGNLLMLSEMKMVIKK